MSACIFDGNIPTYSASGTVYFNSVEMEDVLIKSSTKYLFTTSLDGKFNVSVPKDTIIYPEKSGYTFTPSQITITEDTQNILFVAKQIEPLNGSINLAEVIITPTSISSFGDNYNYKQNGEDSLKLSALEITINNKTINPIKNNNCYAIKNKSNSIKIDDDITLPTGIDFSIKFRLSTYFVSNNNEYTYTEDKISILEIKEIQSTNNLTSKNQIEYSAFGVNSSNTKITYNVTFVFNYYPII